MEVKLIRRKRARVLGVDMGLLRFDKQTMDEISTIAQGAIIENILTQKTAKGGRLKRNQPATRERKHQAGRPLLSLIDEMHRFIQKGGASWHTVRYMPGNRGVVIGPATEELRELVGWLWEKGYRGYIGLQRKHIAAALLALRRGLKRMMAGAKSGVSRSGGGTIRGDL